MKEVNATTHKQNVLHLLFKAVALIYVYTMESLPFHCRAT